MVLTGWLLTLGWATPAATGDALDRLEEVLELRVDDGTIDPREVLPAIVVSVEPRYQESVGWFANRALEVLGRAFGKSGLRLCEACMAPRAWVEEGSLTWQTGPVSLDEVVRLDASTRGDALPARSAIWVEEHRGGVGVRIVDLGTGRVIFAQNVDPLLVENANTQRMATLTEELERRARGDALAQTFVDAAVYPGQHISLDFTDQWGKTNANLSGVTLSLFDPVVGLGVCHYRSTRLFNTQLGVKGIVSLPTAVASALTQDDEIEVIDPLLTAVGVVRVPFGRSNYGLLATVSTNGEIGLGLSLLNVRLLPVLP